MGGVDIVEKFFSIKDIGIRVVCKVDISSESIIKNFLNNGEEVKEITQEEYTCIPIRKQKVFLITEHDLEDKKKQPR